MKNLIWILVAAAIVFGGYLLFSGRSAQDVVDAVDTSTAGEAVSDAVTATQEAAQEVVDSATEAASDAASAASEAVSDAVTATTDAAADAVNAVTETVNDTTQAVTETAQSASDAADALTTDGFDLAKVSEMIDTSNLEDSQKTLLLNAVEQAQNSPELLEAALTEVRDALGL